MKIVPQIKINILGNKYGSSFKKLPRSLAEHAFLVILIFLFISLLIGAWVSYKYIFLIKQAELQMKEGFFQIKEDAYQGVIFKLDEWESSFRNANSKEFSDPFKVD